ncbi:helix-turn-helix transcriptional regulator [Micropruina sp.]|uniref:helix-turn-helix transcriptional regulator n=1 Tax=Micropruina sp. TaxID=2737536 RepID=UPI0039E37D74
MPAEVVPDRWLTKREVANLLCISEETVRWRTKRGFLTAYRQPGTRSVRYKESDIEAAMKPIAAPVQPQRVEFVTDDGVNIEYGAGTGQ